MVRHTQTIRRLLTTNCLSMFDDFVGLALKGLKHFFLYVLLHVNFETIHRTKVSEYVLVWQIFCFPFYLGKSIKHFILQFVSGQRMF